MNLRQREDVGICEGAVAVNELTSRQVRISVWTACAIQGMISECWMAERKPIPSAAERKSKPGELDELLKAMQLPRRAVSRGA